jgi:hypothetical protein
MMRFFPVLCVVAGLALLAEADVYMHNPRGSNDRNCERNVNRNNENRLFDRYVTVFLRCQNTS